MSWIIASKFNKMPKVCQMHNIAFSTLNNINISTQIVLIIILWSSNKIAMQLSLLQYFITTWYVCDSINQNTMFNL